MLILSVSVNLFLTLFAVILWKRHSYYRNRLFVMRRLMHSKTAKMNMQKTELRDLAVKYKDMFLASERNRSLEAAYRESEG